MKKILFIPGWGILWNGPKIATNPEHDIHIDYLDDYRNITIDLLQRYDIIIAHSLGCLYLALALKDTSAFPDLNSRIRLYNPIIESKKLSLIYHGIVNGITFCMIGGGRIIGKMLINCLLYPKEIIQQSIITIQSSSEDKIRLYKQYKHAYLSVQDEYSKQYFTQLPNVQEIFGHHDEIYIDNNIFDILLQE